MLHQEATHLSTIYFDERLLLHRTKSKNVIHPFIMDEMLVCYNHSAGVYTFDELRF